MRRLRSGVLVSLVCNAELISFCSCVGDSRSRVSCFLLVLILIFSRSTLVSFSWSKKRAWRWFTHNPSTAHMVVIHMP